LRQDALQEKIYFPHPPSKNIQLAVSKSHGEESEIKPLLYELHPVGQTKKESTSS
jgi:hypothetical protein